MPLKNICFSRIYVKSHINKFLERTIKMRQYTNERVIPSWFRWTLIIIAILIIGCFIYGIFLYKDIQQSKTESYPKAVDEVLQETDVETISDVTHFYGEETYYVVYGVTADQEEKIVFVPEKGEDNAVTILDIADIMASEEVTSLWQSECNNCELIKIVPAMIDSETLWEITYRDESDRYVIDYVSIYDGASFEQYRFRQMFN